LEKRDVLTAAKEEIKAGASIRNRGHTEVISLSGGQIKKKRHKGKKKEFLTKGEESK